MSGSETSPGAYVPDPRRWKALGVCLLAGFITLLDVSIVNVALPSIRRGLGATAGDIQWVVAGYALSFGLLLVPAGRLGDARGRRLLFMTGLSLFAAASVLCGTAQNALWLVLARLFQGLAGGLVSPQVSALIQQLFRGAERGRAFGLFGAVIGLSTAVGPVLGGVIIELFGAVHGWRWIFFVNLPVCLAALLLAARLLPGPERHIRPCARDLDPAGVVLLGTGVALLLLPLVQGRQWTGPGTWLMFPAAGVVLACFVLWERRHARRAQPLVDLRLFGLRSYAFGSVLMLAYFAGFTSIFFVLTLYLQAGLGYSALAAGLTTVPFAVGSGVAAAVSGRLVARYGRALVVAALTVVAAGLALVIVAVSAVPGRAAGWALAAPLLLAGLGGGAVIAPNQTLTLSAVPPAQGGSAGGVLQTGQRLGSAAGIAATGSVFFSRLAASGNDWPTAFRYSVAVSLAFVLCALGVAVADLRVRHRAAASGGGPAREV
ncbi:DHA2 family efflux MFS transporter permease subunit [Streptomyces sp. RKND-216]|uniref:MFS transporter n=1 Tax=Streptomyces sp. RKND-216 TaxID=2562581 RepID=UPI00109DB13C|nr:MFS transporter [Streptomyces sp. RKND-216]THA23593.1 DHA2 family efflux MFS transporter permease subunit [Streptomyces sp. RKND-216]